MRTYTIKSPHKMKIWEAMETARELVKALGITPDLLPLIQQTLSDTQFISDILYILIGF